MITPKHKKRLALILSLAIALLAIGWLAAVMYYTGMDIVLNPKTAVQIARAYDNPEIRTRFEDWYSRPLTFPPEALDVEPFSNDLMSIAQSAMAQSLSLLISAETFESVAEAPKEELAARLAEMGPAIDAFEQFVLRPDFNYNATEGNSGLGGNLSFIHTMVKALRLKTFALILEGHSDEALKTAETAARAAAVDIYDGVYNAVISATTSGIGTDAWRQAVAHCDDPELLRETLKKQNELGPRLPNFPVGIPAEVIDYIAYFRAARRLKPLLQIPIQDMTGRQMFAELYHVQLSLNLWTLGPQDLRTMRIIAGELPVPMPKSVERRVALYNYVQHIPNDLEARTRCAVARAEFELLRVATARKIYELENGAPSKSLADLLPDLLPAASFDVFATNGETLKLDSNGRPYSIGPDAHDDLAAIVYDSTNGTVSVGDIWLGE